MRDPSGILSEYYYDEAGLLFAIRRGDIFHYVATDHVGTPRVVSDAEGQVVKILDHDSFGQLTSDTNPGFDLPVGFAGGLADRDWVGAVRIPRLRSGGRPMERPRSTPLRRRTSQSLRLCEQQSDQPP